MFWTGVKFLIGNKLVTYHVRRRNAATKRTYVSLRSSVIRRRQSVGWLVSQAVRNVRLTSYIGKWELLLRGHRQHGYLVCLLTTQCDYSGSLGGAAGMKEGLDPWFADPDGEPVVKQRGG